ncbi:MAG: 4-hydroxythreonine-4-phosphate dehydrogenase PdxA [Bacteroidota bacterium]|nr:4-hydroxythreonine-4-phosphate dehydrogenase PdxA [Bacteroidota bacterium]
MKKPLLGISQGDPNGVGLEVIIKTFQHEFLFENCVPILYANPKTFAIHKSQLNIEKPNYVLIRDVSEAKQNQLNLIVSSQESFNVNFGKVDDNAGKEAFLALNRMMQDVKAGKLDIIVTAPLDKSTVKIEQGFTGHTGFITQFLNQSESLMVLYNDDIKVGLITEHIPISKISQTLNKDLIVRKLKIAHESLKIDFGIAKPKIAVLGLNPHNGDNGKMGNEENEIIIPAINEAKENGVFCMGPYSADGFFGMKQYTQFDLVMSMYHDQGLIPFKSMAFDDGVNFTAGLSIVRTSPDHGTAYDIAGKNIASNLSFTNAVFEGIKSFHTRNESNAFLENPLKFSELKRERFRLEKG